MNPYGPPPQNYYQQPYAAPYAHQQAPGYRANVFAPPHARGGPVPSPTIKKIKLACGITQVVTMLFTILFFVIAGIVGGNDAGPFIAIGFLFFMLWEFAMIGYSITNMIWIYKFWTWIPPEQRWGNLWKKYTSPGQAVGFMFIPYFNIYWMFVIYFGICDVFERMRVSYPTDKKSPKDFAIMMLIVSMLFFPAAPFMYYLFAKKCEEIAHDMQARMAVQPV